MDSGAVQSCISDKCAKKLKLKILPVNDDVNLVTADKSKIIILGCVDVTLSLQGLLIPQCLYVLQDLAHDILLGNDFMRETQAIISYSDRSLSLFDGIVKAPLTFKNGKQFLATLAKDITIPPLTEVVTKIRIPRKYCHTTCLIETFEPLKNKRVLVAGAIIKPKNEYSICRICNISQQPRTLRKHRPIACISELNLNDPINRAMLSLDEPNSNVQSTKNDADVQMSYEEKKAKLEELGINLCNDNLTEDQLKQLVQLLFKYREIFCTDYDGLRASKLPPVHIELKDSKIIRQKQYPLPYHHEIALEKITDKLLDAGIVKTSNSAWNSPALIIRKKSFDPKDPSNLAGVRMVIDYRRVNALIKDEFQPLMSTDSIFNQIAEAHSSWFSTFDFTASFYQVPLDEQSSQITAYSTRSQHVSFVRLPMGLRASPIQFLSQMYSLFRQELRTHLAIYMDDGILFSQTFSQHMELLQNIFQKLQQTGLKINPQKSLFAKEKLQFLAFEFNKEGMKIDESRFEKIRNIKPPNSVKQLKAVYGFFNFFRKHCPKYSILTAPWRALLQADSIFKWTEKEQQVLDKLKEILLQNAVLHYPRMSETFYLQTDASKLGIAYSLWQKTGNDFRPISFGGRSLKRHESTLSATDSELLAILEGITHFRSFLTGPKGFIILSDNISLKFIKNLKHSTSPKLVRYSLLLQNLNFEIQHVPGRLNVVLDYLSRNPTDESTATQSTTDPLLNVDHYNFLNSLQVEQLIEDNDWHCQQRIKQKQKYKLYTLSTMPLSERQASEQNSIENNQDVSESQLIIQQTHDQMHAQFSDLINLETQAQNDDFNAAMIEFLQSNKLPLNADLARQIVFQSQDFFIRNNKLFHLGRLSKRARIKKLIGRFEQLVVPQCFKLNILQAYHDLFHHSHSKSYLTARKKFHWKGQYSDFKEYAKSCDVCLQISASKPTLHERHALPLSSNLFETIQIDFHSVLVNKRFAKEQTFKHVFVIIDQHSQYVELIPTKDQLATTAANELFKYILRYGVFKNIISDRSSTFLNETFRALLQMPGMQAIHYKTSPYYPETNGITEKQNRAIIKILRANCQDQLNFHNYLPVIACAINTTHNAALGCSPHFVLFGQDYRTPLDSIMGSEINSIRQFAIPEGLSFIQEQLSLLRKLTHQQVSENRAYEKKQHDKKVEPISFQIGDKVYLHQVFDKTLKNKKHAVQFVGPFAIIDMKNSVLVKLQHFHTGKILKNWINVKHLRSSRDQRRDRLMDRLQQDQMDDSNHTTIATVSNDPQMRSSLMIPTGLVMRYSHTQDATHLLPSLVSKYTAEPIRIPDYRSHESTLRPTAQGQCGEQAAHTATDLSHTSVTTALSDVGIVSNSQIGIRQSEITNTEQQPHMFPERHKRHNIPHGRQLNPLAQSFHPSNVNHLSVTEPSDNGTPLEIHEFTSTPPNQQHKHQCSDIKEVTSVKQIGKQRYGRVVFQDKSLRPTYIAWQAIPSKQRIKYFVDKYQRVRKGK